MKHAASILAILAVAVIVGCEDSSIIDPVAPAAASEDVQLSKNLTVNTIDLHAILPDPARGLNAFAEVVGSTTYRSVVYPFDPIPPNPQFAVSLSLKTYADIGPYQPNVPPTPSDPEWRVSGGSDDFVIIPSSGETFLTKSYQMEGRSDGTLLTIEFRVTIGGVELADMWLEQLTLPPVQPPDLY
jgi:hypothetical protein